MAKVIGNSLLGLAGSYVFIIVRDKQVFLQNWKNIFRAVKDNLKVYTEIRIYKFHKVVSLILSTQEKSPANHTVVKGSSKNVSFFAIKGTITATNPQHAYPLE